MSTPTGFMEYSRQIQPERDPAERVLDWKEFHLHLTEEELRTQASRCMDCGTPYCHMGMELASGTSGCPVNNLIPEWNDLMCRGLWQEALERLQATNNFPEFTGRVCPAPCEGSCTVGLIGESVTIKSIEEEIIERGFREGWVKAKPPQRRTGKRVAVVGSGPAGLACADQLNQAGHSVTVYERDDRIGGLLTYGIPTMKLDKEVVERRVRLLAEEGIQFVTNIEIGTDILARELVEQYDAVVLCAGATKPREFVIEGSELEGIHYAMDYLNGTIKSYLNSGLEDGSYVSAAGKDVIVIGGGDTGTDCVATALRHGCRSITQFGTRPQLPVVRDEATNPWPQFPNVYTIDYAHQEAKALYGRDPREFSIMTTRFVGDDQGRVKELHTVQIERIVDEQGRKTYRSIPGTERVYPAQLVIIAVGFDGPESMLIDQLHLDTDRHTNVKAVKDKYGTKSRNVFVAGDMRRGQSLVVWAIHEGREAAREVDRYLANPLSSRQG